LLSLDESTSANDAAKILGVSVQFAAIKAFSVCFGLAAFQIVMGGVRWVVLPRLAPYLKMLNVLISLAAVF
jgi:hypothetical protein